MNSYDVVFCVLTYKNNRDLKEFVTNLKEDHINFTYKVVVVNSYADRDSLIEIEKVAFENDCDFIPVENKGYGYGNNIGISHIKATYNFNYLVVCNPDTLIKKLDVQALKNLNQTIIAPKIINLNGKNQNPMNVRYMPFSEKVLYKGFKTNNKWMFILGVGLIKINNLLGKLKPSKRKMIHACHGSFIIFDDQAINKLYPIFDENIFLFGEEGDLAQKAKQNNIKIVYNDDIEILHKEDGSMSLSDKNLNQIVRDSYIYYYEKWNLGLK